MEEHGKWSVVYDAAKRERGEEPTQKLGRVDKIVGSAEMRAIQQACQSGQKLIAQAHSSPFSLLRVLRHHTTSTTRPVLGRQEAINS